MRTLHKRIATAVLYSIVLTAQLAMANVTPAPKTGATTALTPPTTAEAARTCQQLRTTGPADISKALLTLTAKLPKVPASDVAAFARENTAVIPDGVATFRKPLYHAWLAGRYLERATGQIGVVPNAASPTLRSLMLADSANTTSGYVSIATDALLLAAAARSDAGKAVPSNAQLQDYAFDLQQISLMLNTLVMCSLRQPG